MLLIIRFFGMLILLNLSEGFCIKGNLSHNLNLIQILLGFRILNFVSIDDILNFEFVEKFVSVDDILNFECKIYYRGVPAINQE